MARSGWSDSEDGDLRLPLVTAVLLVVFALVYLHEVDVSEAHHERGLSTTTLLALGGLSRGLVASGQWYRMLSAPFLHGGAGHLIGNAVTFALAGLALERLVGHAWMFCIFAAGALAGSVGSLVMLGPTTVSVGASGAIMAMLTALLMVSLRLPAGRARRHIQIQGGRVAISALIPAGHVAGTATIDYGCHAGGAMFGALLGLLLLGNWERGAILPSCRGPAALLAAAGAIAFATSAYAVRISDSPAALTSGLIPADELPRNLGDIDVRAETLVQRYPADPRSFELVGTLRLRQGDYAEAEEDFRRAIKLDEDRPGVLLPAFSTITRALLAVSVLAQGRRAEAQDLAGPVCAEPPEQVRGVLASNKLCQS